MTIKKACIKTIKAFDRHTCTMLMAGTYVLQSTRAKFTQYKVNPTCTLCGDEPENHKHLLYYPDIWQKIGTKFINLVLLMPELCFFVRLKFYSVHFTNGVSFMQ